MKFKADVNREQDIPTAALPDIIFMLLFFFMVSTVMRETELKVLQDIPRAQQLVKLDRKDLIAHLYIGVPRQKEYGTEPVIQADGVIIQLKQVTSWVEEHRSELPESERNQLTISLKADKGVQMGLITDIQMELRKANARKIIYQTPKKAED